MCLSTFMYIQHLQHITQLNHGGIFKQLETKPTNDILGEHKFQIHCTSHQIYRSIYLLHHLLTQHDIEIALIKTPFGLANTRNTTQQPWMETIESKGSQSKKNKRASQMQEYLLPLKSTCHPSETQKRTARTVPIFYPCGFVLSVNLLRNFSCFGTKSFLEFSFGSNKRWK